jgi:putative membrane protein
MKNVFPIACCLILSSAPANAAVKKHAAAAPMTDQKFLDFAAQADMTDAHLGQMAAGQARSQSVKDYAQTLVNDHTKDYGQLSVIAAHASLTIPKGIDAAHGRTIAPFKALKGTAFDVRYLHEVISGHTNAISVYKREAADAHNPELKAYASQTLPTLQKHLDGAKDLERARPSGKK